MNANVQVVKIESRRVDGSSAAWLRSSVSEAWKQGATAVVLDFGEVLYIDSLGLSSLISEQRRRPAGSRIVLCSLGDYVRDVIEVTQLVKAFDIYGSAEAAKYALS